MGKRIRVTKTVPGYKHTRFEGTCDEGVTTDEIKKEFYHPLFGGRGATVTSGKWSAVRHDD